jgi:hypothetical protein
VYNTLHRYIPTAFAAVAPNEQAIAQALARKDDPWETVRYARNSLEKKLKVIGLSMELPPVPHLPAV